MDNILKTNPYEPTNIWRSKSTVLKTPAGKIGAQKPPHIQLAPLATETDDPDEQRSICESRIVHYRNNLPLPFIHRIVDVGKKLKKHTDPSPEHRIDTLTIIRAIELFAYIDMSNIILPPHENHYHQHHPWLVNPRESIFRFHNTRQSAATVVSKNKALAVHKLPWTDHGITLMFVIAHWILDDQPDFSAMAGESYLTGQNWQDIQYLMGLFQWYIPSIGIIEWMSIVDQSSRSDYEIQIDQLFKALTKTNVGGSMAFITPAQLFRAICTRESSTE